MKKIPVWKNVVLLVAALVVIIIATLAWFHSGRWAAVEDIMVKVGKATYIQVSGPNGDEWSDDLNVEVGVNKNFKEVSGDGLKLYEPVYDFLENTTGELSTQIVSFKQVGVNEKYYEETFDFRSDMSQYIYLAPESSVTAVDEQGNSYIDGAIRVAFFEVDAAGNEVLKCIWAPNSKVEYSAATNSFTRDGKVESFYYYQKSVTPVDPDSLVGGATNANVAVISTAGTDAAGCGYNATHKFMWSNGEHMPANAPSLLTLNELGEDSLYYKTLKVKVWLEGHDRECVSLLSGQKFTMKLQFSAQEVE